jgi:integrase
MNLGPATAGNIDTMRELAETVRAKAKLGQDTLGEQQEARAKVMQTVTLGSLVPAHLKTRHAGLRPRSFEMAERCLTKHWAPLHGLAIDGIRRTDVVKVVDAIAEERGPVSADRARSVLSAFFSWAMDKGYVDANPCMNIKQRASGETRTRALSEEELVGVWNHSEFDDFGRITRLLILTGCRKREIAELEWREIDFEKRQILLPKDRVKNGEEFILPLSEQALAILLKCPAVAGRERVFGSFSWSRSKRALDERLPKAMPSWTHHDLRRTFVTLIAETGIAQPHIIEAMVNHISGHKAGVAGIYNRATYLAEKRQAFDIWGQYVKDLLAGRKGKVAALNPRAA